MKPVYPAPRNTSPLMARVERSNIFFKKTLPDEAGCWIYMERHDSSENVHRFYQVIVTAGLFGDWSIVREWGRVGSPGTLRFDWFGSYDEAARYARKILKQKLKKGYFEK